MPPPNAGLEIEPGDGISLMLPKPLGVIGKVNGSQTHITFGQSPLGSPLFTTVLQLPPGPGPGPPPLFHEQVAPPMEMSAESRLPVLSVPE